MADKLPQNELEVKQSGNVIECGTLEIFLPFLFPTPVLAMPLQRTYAFNNHKVQQWGVHITAYADAYDSICYCTFLACRSRFSRPNRSIHLSCS